MLCLSNSLEIVGSHSAYFVVPGLPTVAIVTTCVTSRDSGWLLWILLDFSEQSKNIDKYLSLPVMYLIAVVNSLWLGNALWQHKRGSSLPHGNGLLPNGTRPLPGKMLTYQL